MSEHNLEIVRRAYEAVNASLEWPEELFDPNVELDVRDVTVEVEVIRGREAAEELLRDYWQTFEDFYVEVLEVLYVDEDRVVTAVRDGGRMKGSDAEVWNQLFHILTLRDGRIVRFSSHTEKKQALDAARLSE